MKAEELRKDFPIFQNRPELVYLDNAATSQKPEQVIKAVENYYRENNSNVGRGLYDLAGDATEIYRSSRRILADFIGAKTNETVFTSGCTEGMNLLANSLPKGKVLVPEMAHHSEQLPWRYNGHEVDFLPTVEGRIDIDYYRQTIDSNTDYISVSHVSNIFGVENPVEEIVEIAHEQDALVILDAAQSIPRMDVNVKNLGVDFMVFSGHKMLGPTGTGVLYGKKELLEELRPFKVGGGMVRKVGKYDAEFESTPSKFEAGTQNIAGFAGLKEAAEYLEIVGRDKIQRHEKELVQDAREKLSRIEGVKVISPKNASMISFTTEFAHPHDVAEIMSQNNVAVRAGHHCAQPQMEQLDINGSVRISPYLYNTKDEMDKAVEAVQETREVFK